MNRVRAAVVLAVVVVPTVALPQKLLGAKEVIRRIGTKVTAPGAPRKPTVFEFAASLTKMPPKQSGEAWAKACLKAPVFSEVGMTGETFYENEFSALPGPETWIYIDAYFTKSKSPTIYRILGSYLVGDKARLRKLILQAAKENKDSIDIWSVMLQFGLAWQDKELASMAIHKMVANQNEALVPDDPRKYSERKNRIGKFLRIPDLASRLGSATATELIRYALKNTKAMVIPRDKAGLDIAVSLCKKEGATYPIPRYELIQVTSAGDLYPLLTKWFPKAGSEAKPRAKAFYTQLKLLMGGADIDWSDFEFLRDSRYQNESYYPTVRIDDDFEKKLENSSVASRAIGPLEKQMMIKPTYDLLKSYHTAAKALGTPKRMVPVLEHILSLNAKGKYDYTRSEAGEVLLGIHSNGKTNQQIADMLLEYVKFGRTNAGMAMRAGQLLGRNDLIEAALSAQKADDQEDYLESLFQLKRYSALESDALYREFGGADWLLKGYIALDRYQDVVDLIDKYPGWNDTDLRNVEFGYRSEPDMNVDYGIAKALLKVGRRNAGLRVLRKSLWSEGPVGPAYSLLIETLGDAQASAELNKMIAEDPYAFGPFVWKAKILWKQGKLADAESAVRKALSNDPLGDKKHEEREYLARSILAGILQAENRSDEAKKQSLLVEATLRANHASEYIDAGFVADGIEKLKGIVSTCPDSFYAQGVLAQALLSAGRGEESKPHFQKAFELMPENTSRSDSPPYAIWDLLDEPPAQEIAAKVFTERLKKEPSNPHLHYLMASLRSNQNRDAECLDWIRKVTKLDPSYLRAFDLMNRGEITTEPKNSEIVATVIPRLDPRRRHGYHSREDLLLLNPKGFYEACRYANRFHFEKEPVYPLAAAVKEHASGGRGTAIRYYGLSDTLPGKACFDTKLMKGLLRLIREKTRGSGFSMYDD